MMKYLFLLLVCVAWCCEASTVQQQYSELFAQMRSRGAEITDAIRYPHMFNDTGVGVLVVKDIGPRQVILRFKLETYLSELNLMHTTLGPIFPKLDAFHGLLLTILYEKHLGNKSQFARYLSLLEQDLLPLPRFWTTEELEELQDSLVIRKCLLAKQRVQDGYIGLRQLLWEHGQTELYEYITLKTYHWATGIVQSRSFEGHNDTFATIPVADLVNHRAYDFASWRIVHDTDFEFITFHNGFRKGEQLFYNYGDGEK